MTEISIASSIDELRFRLQGGVHESGDAFYEDSCTLFNTMIDRRPRLVAECVVVDDVVATLAFARDHDLPIADRIPDARFEVLADGAHQPFQEVPDEFNARIDAFWREAEARAPEAS